MEDGMVYWTGGKGGIEFGQGSMWNLARGIVSPIFFSGGDASPCNFTTKMLRCI